MDGKYNKSLIKDFITTSKIVLRHTTVDRLTEEINNLSKEIQQYIKLVTFATKDSKNRLKLVEERKQNNDFPKWFICEMGFS